MEETENTENTEQQMQDDGSSLDIPVVTPKPLFDAKKFEGNKVPIMSITRGVIDSHWIPEVDDKGKTTGKRIKDLTKTVKQHVVYVETAVVNPEDTENPITIKKRFNLQKDKDGNVIIKKTAKAKLWIFMRKMGATKLEDLKGMHVLLTTVPASDPEDDRLFLSFSTE